MSTWALASSLFLVFDTEEGSGASSTDWTADEKAQIRYRLGIDGTSSAPSATPTLAYATQVDAVETDLTTLLTRVDVTLSTRLASSAYTAPDNAGISTLLGRLTATRAGNLDNLDATVSSRLASSAYTAPDNAGISAIYTEVGATGTDVDAIKAKTDQLTFTVTNTLNTNMLYVKGQLVQGAGTEADPWRP